jgi:hypothetical protein
MAVPVEVFPVFVPPSEVVTMAVTAVVVVAVE